MSPSTLCQEYLSGTSLNKLAKKYSMHTSKMSKIIKQEGIILRKHSDSNRKYRLRENYFEIINSEEKAYILGFLLADGNVWKNQIRLMLHARDANVLQHIAKCIYLDPYPLQTRSDKDTLCLKISSEKMANDLRALGITERKSLTVIPPILNTDLICHFIRGIFDGDGCISIGTKSRKMKQYITYSFTILGSEHTIKYIFDSMLASGISTHMHKKGKIFLLRTSSYKQILKIYEFLYTEDTIFLDRKKTKFL